MAIAPIIIAAALGAAGSIYGANKAGKDSAAANQAATDEMNAQKLANEQWYQQKMNENYLDSAEAQAALTKAREMAKEQMASRLHFFLMESLLSLL